MSTENNKFFPRSESQEWTDPAFPPDSGSLISKQALVSKKEFLKDITWKRASNLEACFNDREDIKVIHQDIEQGSLSDCYFVASILSLAYRDPL